MRAFITQKSALTLCWILVPFFARGAPALPLERPATGPTIVELKANGEVVPNGMKPLADSADIKKFLAGEFARQERSAKLNRVRLAPALLIRADEDVRYMRLHELMELAKSVGFVNVSVEPMSRRK